MKISELDCSIVATRLTLRDCIEGGVITPIKPDNPNGRNNDQLNDQVVLVLNGPHSMMLGKVIGADDVQDKYTVQLLQNWKQLYSRKKTKTQQVTVSRHDLVTNPKFNINLKCLMGVQKSYGQSAPITLRDLMSNPKSKISPNSMHEKKGIVDELKRVADELNRVNLVVLVETEKGVNGSEFVESLANLPGNVSVAHNHLISTMEVHDVPRHFLSTMDQWDGTLGSSDHT